MRILNAANELNAGNRAVCLAIGVFDGVHLGHQQIIRQTVADARERDALAVVVTFDRHPDEVVAPHRVPPLIYSGPQKLRAIAALGADALVLLHFDEALSREPGEAFIRGLAGDLGRIRSLWVGTEFTFGHRRRGDVALLGKLGAEMGFVVHGVDAVLFEGEVISSTRIREAIRMGRLELAGRMLGRPYSLAARIVPGDGLGRQLGFPTANLDTAGLVLPPRGVYAAEARVEDTTRRAAVNIGFRPTVEKAQPRLRVEAHLLDTNEELIGREVEIVFHRKLRDENKFASLAELREQIARDVAQVRRGG